MLDSYKELTPVIYGEDAIKYLENRAEAGAVCFSPHWHERMELLYIVSGQLELYLGREHLSVCPGQLAVIAPCRMHCGIAGKEGVVYHTIMFHVEKFCNATGASEKYLVPVCRYKAGFLAVADHPRLRDALDRLVEALTGAGGGNPLVAVGIVYEVIGFLYQYCGDGNGMLCGGDREFGEVLAYMNSHFMEKISAKDMSRRFGYEEAYFCRRFKAVTGITVMKYLLALRMEQAQRLLKDTDEDVGMIAWKCGFVDSGYFSNCFRRHFGCSPTGFRRMRGKGRSGSS